MYSDEKIKMNDSSVNNFKLNPETNSDLPSKSIQKCDLVKVDRRNVLEEPPGGKMLQL